MLQESRTATLEKVQQLDLALQATQKELAQYAESDPQRVDAMRTPCLPACSVVPGQCPTQITSKSQLDLCYYDAVSIAEEATCVAIAAANRWLGEWVSIFPKLVWAQGGGDMHWQS